jgi:hypothetical protein
MQHFSQMREIAMAPRKMSVHSAWWPTSGVAATSLKNSGRFCQNLQVKLSLSTACRQGSGGHHAKPCDGERGSHMKNYRTAGGGFSTSATGCCV